MFESNDQYSANLYSTNHKFFITKEDLDHVVLYNSMGGETYIQPIYGGGEYLIWPNTKQIIDQTVKRNRMFAALLIILGGVQYYAF